MCHKNTQVKCKYGSGPIIFDRVMPFELMHLGLRIFLMSCFSNVLKYLQKFCRYIKCYNPKCWIFDFIEEKSIIYTVDDDLTGIF